MPNEKPEDVIDDLNPAIKEQEEFDEVFDKIMSDDDPSVKDPTPADGEGKSASGEADGEGTKDPNNDDPTPGEGDDPTAGEGDPVPELDTTKPSEDVVYWMTRATTAEEALAKEVQRTKSWSGRIKAANDAREKAEKELADAMSHKVKDLDPNATDDEQMLEAFPELKPLFNKLQAKIDSQSEEISSLKTAKEPEPNADDLDPEPIATPAAPAAPAATPTKSPREIITGAHPDFDDIMTSGKLEPWIAVQPAHIKPRLEEIYHRGTGEQVAGMITTFKKSVGWKSPAAASDEDERKKKLEAMKEVDGSTGSGPPAPGPDKDDFDGTAKEIGL